VKEGQVPKAQVLRRQRHPTSTEALWGEVCGEGVSPSHWRRGIVKVLCPSPKILFLKFFGSK